MNSIKVDYIFKNSPFKMNRILNLISGLWPYQSKLKKIFKHSLHFAFLILPLLAEVSDSRNKNLLTKN